MLELFAFGSFWFWVLASVIFFTITGFVNRNEEIDGRIATTFLVIGLGLFFFLGNVDLFFSLMDFIKDEPLKFILYVGSYLIVGAIWSVVKWYYFLLDYKKDYLERKSRSTYPVSFDIPTAKNYKGDIIMWMSYWVVSIFWTFVHQWVHKIWNNIFSKLEGVYNKISNHIFKDIVIEEENKVQDKK